MSIPFAPTATLALLLSTFLYGLGAAFYAYLSNKAVLVAVQELWRSDRVNMLLTVAWFSALGVTAAIMVLHFD